MERRGTQGRLALTSSVFCGASGALIQQREPSGENGVGAVPVDNLKNHLSSESPAHEFSLLAYEEQRQFIAKKTCRVAHSDCNRHKNRYGNVIPYDDSRVPLKQIYGEEGSDYINASFIDGEVEGGEKAYIATQGPLSHTVGDFWRMVWEMGGSLIVMLGKEREKDKIKVDRYWPSNIGDEEIHRCVSVKLVNMKVFEENSITFRLLELTPLPEYISMLKISNNNPTNSTEKTTTQPRLIKHFQYSGWPDHGAPTTTKHIRELLQLVQQQQQPHSHSNQNSNNNNNNTFYSSSAPVAPPALNNTVFTSGVNPNSNKQPMIVHCLPIDHQILTNHGFLFLHEIKKVLLLNQNHQGEPILVANYDPKLKQVKYSPFKLVENASRLQRMVSISKQKDEISLCVTEDHDLYLRQYNKTHFEKVPASSLLNESAITASNFQFLSYSEFGVFQSQQSQKELSDLFSHYNLSSPVKIAAFLTLYGIWLSSFSSSPSHSSVSTSMINAFVREKLSVLGLFANQTISDLASGLFGNSSNLSQNTFQSWIWNLTKEQARYLLFGLSYSSSCCNSETNTYSIFTHSLKLRDDIVRLCIHAGFSVHCKQQEKELRWEIQFTDDKKITHPQIHRNTNISETKYSGVTWCVSVPTGLIIARRAIQANYHSNGSSTVFEASRPMIIGNCSAGIGRTGAFCAIHMTLEKLHELSAKKQPPEVNLYRTVLRMRRSRAGMVQQLEQYGFCYEVILDEALESGIVDGTPRYRVRQKRLSLTQSNDTWPISQQQIQQPQQSIPATSPSTTTTTTTIAVESLRTTISLKSQQFSGDSNNNNNNSLIIPRSENLPIPVRSGENAQIRAVVASAADVASSGGVLARTSSNNLTIPMTDELCELATSHSFDDISLKKHSTLVDTNESEEEEDQQQQQQSTPVIEETPEATPSENMTFTLPMQPMSDSEEEEADESDESRMEVEGLHSKRRAVASLLRSSAPLHRANVPKSSTEQENIPRSLSPPTTVPLRMNITTTTTTTTILSCKNPQFPLHHNYNQQQQQPQSSSNTTHSQPTMPPRLRLSHSPPTPPS